MTRRKIRIFCSPTIVVWSLLMVFLVCGCFIFTVSYKPCLEGLLDHIVIFIFWTLGSLGMSIALILTGARKIFSLITIDETGISRSFLGAFYKLHMSWDEIEEVYYFTALVEFLTFSKYKKVSTMTYNKMRLEKDAIEITLSKRRYKVIAQYLKQPIVGMPEKVLAHLTKDKNKKQ